jgi:hypothetical protein
VRVLHLFILLLGLGWLILFVFLRRLVIFLLRLAVGLLAIGAAGFFLNLELASALDDIVARALDMYGWVVRRRVLLDGVAAVRFNCDLALFLDLGNLAAGLSTAPAP